MKKLIRQAIENNQVKKRYERQHLNLLGTWRKTRRSKEYQKDVNLIQKLYNQGKLSK